MIKLTAVRHGESLGNVKNVIDDNSSPETDTNGLSEKGKLQAVEVAKNLSGYNFDLVILSPLKRTKETLEPYLKDKKIKVIYSELTLERNAGVFAGKPKEAIKEYCLTNNITNRVNFKPQNGESITEVYQRAQKFLVYLKEYFPGKAILMCGHVNFLSCLEFVINNKHLDNFYSYESIKNGEIKEYIID